jgi:hypothetical protein
VVVRLDLSLNPCHLVKASERDLHVLLSSQDASFGCDNEVIVAVRLDLSLNSCHLVRMPQEEKRLLVVVESTSDMTVLWLLSFLICCFFA